jgi:DNA-binding XRE family transcriptional regulator
MSAHMRTHHTEKEIPILCISEEGQVYKIPHSLIDAYIVHDAYSYKKAKIAAQELLNTSPEEAFAEINRKYTKAGALLKGIRIREGLSQKEFAKLIQVTQGDFSKMENGKRPIGKKISAKILSLFGSNIDF